MPIGFAKSFRCWSLAALAATVSSATHANALETAWALDPSASALNFQSIKDGSNIETHSFGHYSGTITPNGMATVAIDLGSVDTKIDMRDVRMRFMFFESFEFPTATITAKLDSDLLDQLSAKRRVSTTLDYTIDLHGVSQPMSSPVVVTLLTDELVSVSSAEPITIKTADFNLDSGIERLQDAGLVQIAPFAPVSFDFVFKSTGPTTGTNQIAAPLPVKALQSPSNPTAKPEVTSLSRSDCAGRFDTVSRSGTINFRSGSADLLKSSEPILDFFANVFQHCRDFKIAVAGHTDSVGNEQFNQSLSQKRAESVALYLVKIGIPQDSLKPVGYGESKPIASNDTAWKRSRNRRIEFMIDGG